MSELNPSTFNFADWFEDAKLPEESTPVFTRADIIGDLSDLERRIKTEGAIAAVEKTAADKTSPLEAEYLEKLQAFKDSKVTVWVRALTGTERKDIRTEHDAAEGEGNEEFIYRLLSASIVGLKKGDGERKAVSMSQADVRRLNDQIGDTQTTAIRDAYLVATNKIPAVDADFLLKSSGSSDATPE